MNLQADPVAQELAALPPAERVAMLRDSGMWRADAVRFRFIEGLLGRMAGQPPAVATVLERKLLAALEAFPSRADDSAARRPRAAKADAACPPLAQLNAHLRQIAAQRSGGEAGDAAANELASARRFRESWEALRTLDRLEQALARSPANAGPLNSHALVVKSLRRMGDLSVDYLRRFLSHAETLLWLEAAREQLPRAAGSKAPKPGRKSSKPARRPAR